MIPNGGYVYLNKVVKWLTFPTSQISALLNLNKISEGVLIAPLVEEVEFRVILQQFLLKNLPKALLDKYFPDHQINFDSALSKGARILITAGIFAILHFQAAQCENGGAISQFMGGLFYSTLIELGDSVLTTMNLHVLFNGLNEVL